MTISIAPQYVKEARRIHDRYHYIVDKLNGILVSISGFREDISQMYAELQEIQENDGTDTQKSDAMNEQVLKLQRMYARVESEQKPYEVAMEQLQKDAQSLLVVLRERYPGMSDEQLKAGLIVGGANL